MFYGICEAEDIDGVGDEGSGDVTTVDVQSLLEAFFFSMSLRCGCFIDRSSFLAKSENSVVETTLLKCRIIRTSRLVDVGLKEVCCVLIKIQQVLKNSAYFKKQNQNIL